jgi:hypothetical protein
VPGAAHANISTASGLIEAVLGPRGLLYSRGAFSLGAMLYKLLAVEIFVCAAPRRDKEWLGFTAKTIR